MRAYELKDNATFAWNLKMNFLYYLFLIGGLMQADSEAHFSERLEQTDYTYSSPKQICAGIMQDFTECVSGTTFTPEAFEDFKYKAHILNMLYPQVSNPEDPYNNHFLDGFSFAEERCCMCDGESHPCDYWDWEFCAILFMSPVRYDGFFYWDEKKDSRAIQYPAIYL